MNERLKYILLYIFVCCSICVGTYVLTSFISTPIVFAQSTESTIDPSLSLGTLDFHVDLPPDVIIKTVGPLQPDTNNVLIASSTNYTVLGVIGRVPAVDSGNYLYCGENYLINDATSYMTGVAGYMLFSMSTELHCSGPLILYYSGGDSTAWQVYYVPYDTRVNSPQMNYKDEMFIYGVIIFLLMFVPIGFIASVFQGFKERKSKNL